ncbi:MAG: hypothetical protein ABR969_07715 [Sedimentisphaerales bacterium]|jgi:hypothetical protein
MNRIQKIAVFSLVVLGCTLLITAISMGLSYHYHGWPKAAKCFGWMSLSGLAGLSPLFIKKDSGAVACDERDKLITRTAVLIGLAASYLWFCLVGSMFAFLFEPVLFKTLGLPIMILGGAFIVVIVQSIMILVQYGRGNKG